MFWDLLITQYLAIDGYFMNLLAHPLFSGYGNFFSSNSVYTSIVNTRLDVLVFIKCRQPI